MSVKRRAATSEAAELHAWNMFFEGGVDYFDDLPKIGIASRGDLEDVIPHALEAWRRLGRRFLDTRPVEPRNPSVPWARREFGEPEDA